MWNMLECLWSNTSVLITKSDTVSHPADIPVLLPELPVILFLDVQLPTEARYLFRMTQFQSFRMCICRFSLSPHTSLFLCVSM